MKRISDYVYRSFSMIDISYHIISMLKISCSPQALEHADYYDIFIWVTFELHLRKYVSGKFVGYRNKSI